MQTRRIRRSQPNDGIVRERRESSIADRTFGMLQHDGPPIDIDELNSAAEEAIVEDVDRGMGG